MDFSASGVEIGNVGALIGWQGVQRPPRLGQRRRRAAEFSRLLALSDTSMRSQKMLSRFPRERFTSLASLSALSSISLSMGCGLGCGPP